MAYTMKAGCTGDEIVIRDRDGEFIWPGKDGWDDYLAWIQKGNKPKASAILKDPVPLSVPLWAVRVILAERGLLESANIKIAASDNITLKTIWEYGNTIDRGSPMTQSLATALGLTSQQVDDLFVAASDVTVE